MVDWRMYSKIQDQKNKGFNRSQAARHLDINRETVSKYWDMKPDEFSMQKYHRKCKADVHKDIIVEWLKEYPDISSAQLYDWILERTKLETLDFQQRSFRNYVKCLRAEYGIKKPEASRQYEAVEELPAGLQSQVDMGEIILETDKGESKKIYCFAMVLSHSRYKYVVWQEKPFTTDSFIAAHIKAFAYFGGRTKEIVYDQDKVLAVSENNGDIIYTAGFQNFINQFKFGVYLCRGADPESKGKIENVVKYAKHNFAEHRKFHDIDSFNDDCRAWLERTGNKKTHETTKKRPVEAFALEKEYLIQVPEYSFVSAVSESISYPVRKDNTVLYKGNRYRVPKGTYKKGIRVNMSIDDKADTVSIADAVTKEVYITHQLSHDKGKLVGQKYHERDKSRSILEQEETIRKRVSCDELVIPYLEKLHKAKSRYYRDQLGVIMKLAEEWDKELMIRGLRYCNERELYSAGNLKSSILFISKTEEETTKNKPRDGTLLPEKYKGDKPEVRDLSVYEDALGRSAVNE